LSWDSNK